MHIPDSMLQGNVCPVTACVSAAGIAYATYKAVKSEAKPSATRFGATTALVFALQMMNFPINNGTSGHLLGGVLAATMLGTPFGVLAIALVVAVQSLVFSDGGLTVLGANVFNMAIIGAGVGGFLKTKLAGWLDGKFSKYLATFAASLISVILASIAVSVELAADGQIAFSKVIAAMVITHAFIGIGEGLITCAACLLFSEQSSTSSTGRSIAMPLAASCVIALLLSPFASGLPDGLEWVAEKYKFLHDAAPAFSSPIPDYAFPSVTNEALATGLAGITGVIICFAAAWAIQAVISRKTSAQA